MQELREVLRPEDCEFVEGIDRTMRHEVRARRVRGVLSALIYGLGATGSVMTMGVAPSVAAEFVQDRQER